MFKILIVDDEKAICEAAQRVLAKGDIKIGDFACVGSLDLGLERCQTMCPDVVLLDLNLIGSSFPAMTVKAIPDFLKCAKTLIVITGTAMAASDELFIEAIKNGASDVLWKPDAMTKGNEGRLAKAMMIALLQYERRNSRN